MLTPFSCSKDSSAMPLAIKIQEYALSQRQETAFSLKLEVDFNGKAFAGYSGGHFSKDSLPLVNEILETAKAGWGTTIFEFWEQLDADFNKEAVHFAKQQAYIKKAALAMVERALIDSYCRARKKSFFHLLKDKSLGLDLNKIRPELKGQNIQTLLDADALPNINLKHPVRKENDLSETASLEALIKNQGIHQLELELTGDSENDFERLVKIAALFESCGVKRYGISLSGHCQYTDPHALKATWDLLSESSEYKHLIYKISHISDPFSKDIEFGNDVLAVFAEWPKRPPMLIDTSDVSPESLNKGLIQGYAGTVHTGRKSIFQSVANRALLTARKNREPIAKFQMRAGECEGINPYAFLQTLAGQAILGNQDIALDSIEFNQQLKALSEAERKQLEQFHGDLFQLNSDGALELKVESGKLCTASAIEAPFGYSLALDLEA